ncbi:hypothetical protein VIGAN_08272200 [Vigna angularis var. angularis]|uniref:Uncharacterized protein n=1 Tax=Vigna angularis var. angularis TaxID=157739 RepID=A0A0S3SSU9_PHAAN|nr:hypothetical protein VIGAN_08272200 [Vigna angularis var. angularis]
MSGEHDLLLYLYALGLLENIRLPCCRASMLSISIAAYLPSCRAFELPICVVELQATKLHAVELLCCWAIGLLFRRSFRLA